MLFAVGVVVQVHEHCRIAADSQEQVAKVAQAVGAEEFVLPEHEPGTLDVVGAGREVAVPEQRHLLLQRAFALEHAPNPPTARFLGGFAVSPAKLLHLLFAFFGAEARQQLLGVFRKCRRVGRLEVGGGGGFDFLKVHEVIDCAFHPPIDGALDVLGHRAERCAVEQVGG